MTAIARLREIAHEPTSRPPAHRIVRRMRNCDAPFICADSRRRLRGGESRARPFQARLDGLGKRDKAAMLAQLLPGGSATLMRNGKPVQMTFEALTDRLSQPGSETHEERIREPLIRVDGNVAIIWAPFEFLLNGKVDHCGRDIVTLVRVDERWLIATIGDNSRTDCGRSR
jgi:hypothetical protein